MRPPGEGRREVGELRELARRETAGSKGGILVASSWLSTALSPLLTESRVSHVEDYPANTVAGLEVNTLADGFFHVATWVLVLAGSITAIKAWREGRFAPSWSFHFGLILAGWGIFNLVEGVVDHHLLGVHHVRDDVGAPLSWDLGFLAFGALLVVAGWLLHKRGLAAMERRARAMGEGASVGR